MNPSDKKNVLFLLEEESAEEMLRKFIPRCFSSLRCTYRKFKGKNNLIQRLEKTIQNHVDNNCPIVILCDQDDDCCVELRDKILNLCKKTHRGSSCVVRIACHEMESWFLAQLDIVAGHFGVPELAKHQKRYEKPDTVKNPSDVLKRITNGNYQKVKGSRIMGEYLDPNITRSVSFKRFVETLRHL
ncbi:MAG: DUF4276 family protein [Planctomycetaceae bacterium]|jgi:hypothetical protein|nr:DUF4276 family protein [Planctomycetaceae bacterium]